MKSLSPSMRKLLSLAVLVVVLAIVLAGCGSRADVASTNLSKAADQFEINRRVIFYNGITDTYIMVVEGLCSIEADTLDDQLELTCRIAENEYKKHFLGLSDNVTYFAEQLESANIDPYHYRVIFRPLTIIPDIEFDTSDN